MSSGEVSCSNCIGACCTDNTELPMSLEEARFLQSAGTLMVTVVSATRTGPQFPNPEDAYQVRVNEYAEKLPLGIGLYKLFSDCVFLEPVKDGMAKCSLFGDPKRPEVCSTFPVGGNRCQEIRLRRGVHY